MKLHHLQKHFNRGLARVCMALRSPNQQIIAINIAIGVAIAIGPLFSIGAINRRTPIPTPIPIPIPTLMYFG